MISCGLSTNTGNMIIAVNARLLLQDKLEGIGRFTSETLKIITRSHPEHQFIFIFDRPYSAEFIYSGNITPVVCFPQARHPVLWYLFFEMAVPRVLRKYKADLFLSCDGWIPLRAKVRCMTVVHDLNFFHYPEFIPWLVRKYYDYFFPRFIRKSYRIATVSEFSRNDIVNRFQIDKRKIDVVYNGANEDFRPLPEDEQAKVREQFSRGCPYFLFVGLIHPRKNIAGLISAFEGFKQSFVSNVKLLIAGSLKWWTPDMQRALDAAYFRHDIIFTGRVSDSELAKITASALALVYVSHFEGFGIPVLEAMHCDVPVIASAVASLPEVGGDAVLYVNPASVESIRQAMLNIFYHHILRRELIEKGRIQRSKFSWEKSAGLLWKSIEKCF
jgi:glycosyltransferase involved in cell wall biosynthesis